MIKFYLSLILAILIIISLFMTGCGKDEEGEEVPSLIGLWEGKLGDEGSDSPEGILEFKQGGDGRAYVMGFVIDASYVYEEEEKVVILTSEKYKSFGNSAEVEGSLFGGEESIEWKNVIIKSNTLTVTEYSDDPPDTMTYTLTRRTEPFPENDSDIDATKVTTNISNAEEIMNKYIVLWVFQADSHGEGGPVAFAFDSVNSLGQGVVKTFIQNEFFATDTLNTLIIGMDFDPAKGLNENTMQDATYIGVVNWDGVSNPWENSIVKIEKDKSAELTLDTFVPAEEFHWFGYARPPMETAMIPFAVWSLFSASS